jgi:glycosyltransferase involved in cell wall biosynthesis
MTILTILIPAYNKEYLGDAFSGISSQSFDDYKLIISDDSPDAEITTLLNNGHYNKFFNKNHSIEVIRGPLNGRQNHERLLAHWAGTTPYVHFHLDDDIIYPEFYKTHLEAHKLGNYAATVTPRWIADIHGHPKSIRALPSEIIKSNLYSYVIDKKFLAESVITGCNNWLGEFTNMVFSKTGAMLFPGPPEQGLSYYGLMDIGILLNASLYENILFIKDYQSVFRQHPKQTTFNVRSHGGKIMHYCWVTYALHAWRLGYISTEEAYVAIKKASIDAITNLTEDATSLEFNDLFNFRNFNLDEFYERYEKFWIKLLKSHPSTAKSLLWNQELKHS